MNNEATLFHLSSFLQAGELYHIARVNITSKQDLTYHYHDYAELLWVEHGTGFHYINDTYIKLSPGDLVMIRPTDKHTFCPSNKGLTIVNIAFSKETLDYFHIRYFSNLAQFFWTNSVLPFHISISSWLLKRFSICVDEAIKRPRTLLQQDSFLLFIFRHLNAQNLTEKSKDIPEWLFNTIGEFNTPENLSKGIDFFAVKCNRNKDYMNRIVKKATGKTLVSLITDMRLHYATVQLTMTSMPIKEICLNCGYQNLAYFYQIFAKRFDMTPKQYREINQKIV